jgi:uncharacterized protein YdcH (DUF465 family)
MSAKTATNPAMPSLVPPEVQALFGDPPLMRGEDVGLYNKLMAQFTKLIEPTDMIEWWWVKDITDHTWEIRRLRRFKVLFVELRRDGVVESREMFATLRADEDAEYVPVPVPDSEKDSAELFMRLVDQYKSVDKMIASAELRRDRTLREIERRREHLARRVRKASDEIIHGQSRELPQAA